MDAWRRRGSLIALVIAAVVLGQFVEIGPAAASSTSPGGSSQNSAPGKGAATATTSGGQAGSVGHVTVGHSSKNDLSPKLYDITPKPVTKAANKSLPVLALPAPRQTKNTMDTAVQSKLAAPKMPATRLNFDGISYPGVNCFCAPPDTNGEVGDNQYVQIVNTGLQVFDKATGNSVLGPISIESLWSGFGGPCETSGEGDPVVLYDQLANRWVVTQFAQFPPTFECVAVSTSDDATGSWNRYAFDLGTQFGVNFYDYPKLGVWPDAYYLSFNVFTSAGSFLGPQPFALDRSAMLAGNAATIVSTGMLTSSDDQLMPADMDGSNPPPAGAPNPFTEIGTNTTWKLWRFHVDFATPANSTFTQAGTLTPDPFSVICGGGACVPQAGVTDVLDTLGDRSMFRSAYRHFADGREALVGNMTVASNGVAGIRWYEINNATSGTPSFVQQSTYQPDDTWRWMGSAAMDALGDLAVGFSASSSTINPQIRYAGRLAGDPPNTLAQGEATLYAGTASQTDTNNRWGDYSDLTVDPSDDCTFWYTNEYYAANDSSTWNTRIGNFTFPNCTTGPSGTLTGTVTDASTNQPIAGAQVDTGFGATTTDSAGHYTITLPTGPYTITYSSFGYVSKVENNVQITGAAATTLNVSLQPSPSVTVSGTVTDGSGHGWPLYTRIDVASDPNGPLFTDPISGRYSITLPANSSYKVTFTAQLTGYHVVQQTIDLGGSDLTHDVAIPVTADCTAPGYGFDDALQEDFDSGNNFPPPGWSVVDNVGKGQVWQLNDPNGLPNYTGGTGNFADINSFAYGPGDTQDTSLVTPTLDLSGVAAPQLTFHNNYLASPGPQTGDVDVSTDGGSTWTNVWHHGQDILQGPDLETVQLPEANQSNVKLRFHFTATFSYWWMIDDVTALKCVKRQGGLVEGNVSDLSTGDPVTGVKVTSDDHPADTGTTVATPDDPANPGGYYWMFSSLTGSHPFTASKSLYSPDTGTVDVAADSTVRRDFTLGGGHLVISPTSISKTPVLGTSTTATLQFHNDGTAPAHVKLSERGGSFQILHQQGSKLDTINLDQPASPGWFGDQKPGDTSGVNAGTPKDPSWSTTADYATGIEDNSADIIDGKEYSVGGVDSSGATTNKGYVYNAADNTWSATANMAQPRAKPGVAAVNGKLYVTGGWNTSGSPVAATEIYDPASDSWTTAAPNPSPTAAPGVAVVNNKIYFVGGCVDSACTPSSKVEVYDPASNSWGSAANYPSGVTWEGCGGINGQVYCAGGLNGSTSLATGYVYHPVSDSWSAIANLPIDLWGMVAGAPNGMLVVSSGVTNGLYTITNQGFAYDPSADTWTAIPNAQFPRYRGAGSCGFYKIGGSDGSNVTPDSEVLSELDQCSPNVPWLEESPTEFDVPVNDTIDVAITLSATTDAGVTQPGTNSAQLVVNANTPQTINPIDVTLTVTPPKGWAKLAGTVTGTDCNGDTNPLQGAQVEADGKGYSFSLKTDKDGSYAFWAPTTANPFTVITSNLGYKAQTRTVKLKKGVTVTANFALHAIC